MNPGQERYSNNIMVKVNAIFQRNISAEVLEYANHILDTEAEDTFTRLMIRFAHFRGSLNAYDAAMIVNLASMCNETLRDMYKFALDVDEVGEMVGDRSLDEILRITNDTEFVAYLNANFEY
jgi:hypothetical protein